jgi:hypothetical protein
MRRLLPTLFTLLALAVVPAAASAAIVPGQSIDGPSADIKQFGDVDVAPDGTGALTYVKAEGGVDHIFVSLLAGGQWSMPTRVDTGLTNTSRYPRVAAGNGGRVVVTFLNGNSANKTVQSAIRPNGGSAFSVVAVQTLFLAGIAEVEMNPVSGVAYVVYNDLSGGGGSDLYASMLNGSTWSGVGGNYGDPGAKLDNDPTKAAGADGMRGPRIAVEANNSAFVAWSEEPGGGVYNVWARPLNGVTPGTQVKADLDTIPGSDGTADISDMVDVAAAGAGFPQLVFRQQFKYGAFNVPHAIARSWGGSSFGAGQVVDGLPAGHVQGAEFPRVAVNPNGGGLIGAARQDLNETGQNDVLGSTHTPGNWQAGFRVDSLDNDTDVPTPVVAVGDDGGGAWAWHEHSGTATEVRVRQRSGAGVLQPEAVVSNAAFGTAGEVELEASADAAGHVAIAFTQGAAGSKRIVVALVDPLPGGGGGGGGGGVTDTTAPKITSFSFTASVFRLGSLLPKISRKKTIPTGTTIRFRLDEAATATLSFKRILPGRKVGRRCLAPTRARRHRPRCTRKVAVKTTLKFAAKAGLNKIRFQGRLTRRRKLAPGTYELTIVATDAAKNASKPARRRFTLRAALRHR